MNRWFKVDDISISYIYRIAELYGLDVKWCQEDVMFLYQTTVFSGRGFSNRC